jgi:hypothetical protein
MDITCMAQALQQEMHPTTTSRPNDSPGRVPHDYERIRRAQSPMYSEGIVAISGSGTFRDRLGLGRFARVQMAAVVEC